MPVEPPELSVIIVSYNTRQMTLDCLRALQAGLADMPAEVWVVDNGSTDGTVESIRTAFPAARIIANRQNLGFGAANNQAMREASGRYLMLLNSDAFPQPGAIQALKFFLDTHPAVAVVGPRLCDCDGALQISCYPFPTPARAWAENLWIDRIAPHTARLGDYRRWQHDCERMVDWVIGACLMVRREAYQQIGGFDERFFMYAEESDWQRRMRSAGWQIAFTPAAIVTHLGGASGAAEKPRINRNFFRSLDSYELKHHGILGLMSLRAAMVIGSGIRLCLWSGVLLAMPARRRLAAAKLRLLSWLLVRQVGMWDLRERQTR